jgi:hypothetical protein
MSDDFAISLPHTIEEVDAQWLTSALALRFPGTEVTMVTAGRAIRATGTKVRLLLEYNDVGHVHRLPPTMWFKSGFEPHSDHVRTSHARESFFYDRIAPLGLLNAPVGYFGGTDGQGHAVQLIEDLLARNASFGSALKPLSVDTVAAALGMLARFHAHWWRAPELAELGPPGGTLESDGIVLRLLSAEAWDRAMARPPAAALPAGLRSVGAVHAAMEALWERDRRSDALCMVHGDPHPGNFFFDADGRPGLLDWQRLMQCDWAHDVNYFLVSSMTAADAARHERDLLEGYLLAREAHGVPPMDRKAAWASYRAHTAYGLVWNVVPPEMQTVAVCDAVAERFNAAFARHDVVTVLG